MANLDLLDKNIIGEKSIVIRRNILSKDLKLNLGQIIKFANQDVLKSRYRMVGDEFDDQLCKDINYLVERCDYRIDALTDLDINLSLHNTYKINIKKPITLVLGFVRPRIIRKILEFSSVLPVREILLYQSDYSDSSYLLSSEYGEFLIKERLKYSVCQSAIPYVPTVKIIQNKKLFFKSILPLLAGSRLLGDSMSSFSMVNLLNSDIGNKHDYVNQGFTLFIGPERGFSLAEREIFNAHQIIPINIGAEIYQVDTAMVSMCSQLNLIYQASQV